MKKIALALFLLAAPALVSAAKPAIDLLSARVDPTNLDSLQNGARLFTNYCMACHEAQFMRYGRVAQDLGLSQDLVEENLIFTGAQIGDTMLNAITPELAEQWFGIAPPDLSLTVRIHGADWLYTFLNSFYRDDTAVFGVNNLAFPDISMPHPMWELQGLPEPVYDEREGEVVVVGTEVPEGAGLLSAAQYQQETRDLVNFLAYVSEPVRAERERLGVKVLLFLALFFVVAYLLKKEYWKDVH